MADPQLTTVVRHIRRLVACGETRDRNDGRLLHEFHAGKNERAFAALVDRHGTMVLRVCRHVLQHEQDAEDAFQATFLVLARKAASLRRSPSVAGWLRSVAYRIALQARRNAGRRQAREARAALRSAPNPAADIVWREVQVILHEEIERLGERYRMPFVLCCLEGQSRSDAARQLGLKEGTVWSRLSSARRQLQKRLARRGIELGTVLAAASVAENAFAVPALLVSATVRNAVTAGPGLVGVSSEITCLVNVALKSMTAAKLHSALGVLVISAVVGIGWSALAGPGSSPAENSRAAPADQAGTEIINTDEKTAPRADAYGDPLPAGAILRLGTIRFNHGAGLTHLLFAPDGKTIISEGRRRVRLWDAATGAEIGRSSDPQPLFGETTLALPDGKVLVSLNEESAGDVVRWWDITQRKETRMLRLPGRRSVWSAYHRNALSPDGNLAAIHVQTPAALRVFDLKTGRQLHSFPGGGKDIRAVVFAGNDRLVTADTKARIEIREARTGKLLQQFAHGTPVDFLAISADGRRLASFEQHSNDELNSRHRGVIHLWDLTSGRKEHALRLPPRHDFNNAVFSPDGKVLMTSSYGADAGLLTMWQTASGRKLRELDGLGMSMAFSPDGKRLVEGGWNGKFDIWQLDTAARYSSEDSRHGRANDARLSARGDRIVTVGSAICAWDSRTAKRLDTFPLPPDVFWDRASRTPDGRFLLSFVREEEVYRATIWDTTAKRKLLTLPAPGESAPASTAISADGSLLATSHAGKENIIRIWEMPGGKKRCQLKAGKAWRFHFSHDNKKLFLLGPKIAAMDLASGTELFSWRMQPLKSATTVMTVAQGQPFPAEDDRVAWRVLAISSDSTKIAAIQQTFALAGQASGEDRIAIYDLRTGKLLRHWNDSGKQSNTYEALAFSEDGRLLASSDQHSIHVWEAASGARIHTFHGHRAEITSLGFDRDSRRLVSASYDTTVLCWDLTGRLRDGKLSPARLAPAELETAWRDLADRDAAKAYRAVWALAASGRQAVDFLARHLHPVPRPDAKRIDRLISDLDSSTFAVRRNAYLELKRMDVLAEEALQKAIKANPPLELRRRVESVLGGIHAPVPPVEILQALRAAAALEHAGTPQARRLLQTLAQGAEPAHLTREARFVIKRLR